MTNMQVYTLQNQHAMRYTDHETRFRTCHRQVLYYFSADLKTTVFSEDSCVAANGGVCHPFYIHRSGLVP